MARFRLKHSLALLLIFVLADPIVANADPQPGVAIGPGVGGQVHAIAFDPENPDAIYAGGDVCGVYKYSIAAESWTPWSRGLGFADLNWSFYVDDLLILRAADNVPIAFRGVYAATWGGVYFRPDDQMPWTCLSTGAVYSTGFAADRGGSMRIPFSSLAYDSATQTLYAGAGHGRTEDQFEGRYREFYPTSTCSADSCPGEYSLWSCDLSGATPAPEFQAVSGTDRGKTRQIAIADYIDSEQVPRHEVIYSTNTGIWTVGAPDPLWSVVKPNKSQEYNPATDASVPWGVVVGSDATCYIVTWPPALTMKSGIWKYDLKIRPRGENSPVWSRVVGESDYFWPHAETFSQFLTNSGGDLSDLSIVWNEDGGRDALYFGAGAKEAARPGYLRYGDYNLGGTPTWGWANVHGKHNSELGYPMGAEMFVSDWRHGQIDSTHLSADEVGWHSYDFSMRSLTQFAMNTAADTIMVAVDYAVPMLTTDGGSSWQNLYCTGSDAAGWTTRGLNLLCTGSSTFLPDGKLVIGAWDYGVFVGATPANTSFRHLREATYAPPDWPSAIDVEVLVRGDDTTECYMVDPGRKTGGDPRSEIWTWVDNSWVSIADGLTALLADQHPGVTAAMLAIKDIEFFGEDRVYAAVGVDVTPSSSPWPRFHFYVCEGSRSGGSWAWERWLDVDSSFPRDQETRIVNRMCVIPGANLLMLATKHKGASAGGLFPIDLAAWQLGAAWLGGDYTGSNSSPTTALGRLGVNVTAMEADRLGRFLYVGSGGGDLARSPGRGGLVRFPLNAGVPGAPEILAGFGDVGVGDPDAGDVFGIRGVNNFENMSPGTTRDWEFCTRINDIEIDPNNPRVAYVAVGAGNIHFYHGKFGAWRVSDTGWTHVWGGHETGSGAKTVGISPIDREHLYIGSVGQEFFRADIMPSNHPDIAASASHPLLAAIADSVQVLAVHIAADTTVVTVEAALDSLGLWGEKLILLDNGQGEDLAEGDGLFTSPRFPALLTAGTGHSVRVFAQDATGGYDEREVAVEAVASKARFEDLTEFTGDLATILTEQPYSAVYFKSRPGDPESEDIMIVTFDNVGSLGVGQQPQILQRSALVNGAPQFARKTDDWIGLSGLPRGARGVSYADFDNDGDNDFFLCNPATGGRLYRSWFAQGMQVFTNATDTIFGADATHLSQAIAASWGDYNADGYADLFVAGTNYFNSVQLLATDGFGSGGSSGISYSGWIFRNRGGDAFTKTLWGGQSQNNVLLGACWADLDNDGDLDQITAKYIGGPLQVLENTGFYYPLGDNLMGVTGWGIPLSDPDWVYGANSVTVFDYDHDAYPDLVVTFATHDGNPKVKILRNNFGTGSRVFTPIDVASGTEWNGATVADFDLDGQDDILLHPRASGVAPGLYLADGYGTSATYRDLGFTAGLRGGSTGGAVAVDFDQERNIDLYLGRGEGNDRGALYRNAGQAAASNAWLEVRPRTVSGGYGSLVGTKVIVEAPGRRWQKTVEGGGGRGGQGANQLLFGLGDVTGDVSVTVRFPSGEVDGPVTVSPNGAACEVWEHQAVVLLTPPPKQNLTYDYEFGPGTADWIFRWRTDARRGDPARDRVEIWNYSNYDADGDCGVGIAPGQIRMLAPGDPEVEHLVYLIGDKWHHELRWLALPCGNNCQYKFRVTSGLGSQSQTSNWVNMSTSTFCVADPGDPNQQ